MNANEVVRVTDPDGTVRNALVLKSDQGVVTVVTTAVHEGDTSVFGRATVILENVYPKGRVEARVKDLVASRTDQEATLPPPVLPFYES